MNTIAYSELLKLDNYTLVDVRTPKEFESEPIPNAVNIPVLLNDERAIVGTAYVQQSKEIAKELGINFISKRLPEIFKQVQGLSSKNKKIVFFCARGGMRSGTMCSLFQALGYKCMKLEGGYKAYREFVYKSIPVLNEKFKYVIIHGRTGIGKTKILAKLHEMGYPVLNLEKIADHKGSHFGAIGEKRKQSQKRFETELYEFLVSNDKGYILAESESKRIGNIYIPDSVYDSLVSGYHLIAETTPEHRIKVLMKDYADAPEEALRECIMKISRYTSKKNIESYLQLLENKKLPELAAELIKEYYDPLYQKSIDKYQFNHTIQYSTIDEGVEKVIEFLREKKFI